MFPAIDKTIYVILMLVYHILNVIRKKLVAHLLPILILNNVADIIANFRSTNNWCITTKRCDSSAKIRMLLIVMCTMSDIHTINKPGALVWPCSDVK